MLEQPRQLQKRHIAITFWTAKRIFDVIFALLVGLLTLPCLLVSVLLIVFVDRNRPFFSQDRIGQDGKRFRIYKLRSMRADTPPNVPTSEADPAWITPLGLVLRRTNLDELPQLLCVLTGSMSFI